MGKTNTYIPSYILAVLYFLLPLTECLTCYSCPITEGLSPRDANVNCLINTTEIQCQDDQDRCFSTLSNLDGGRLTKGCTSSDKCVGNTICCTSNFCNAGYATGIKTGYGKLCQIQSDCIQNAEDMVCSSSSDDVTLMCRCTDQGFNQGAICQPKSGIKGVCRKDHQCLLYNSYCEQRVCKCGDQFYPNTTGLTCDLKRPLSSPCSTDMECRSANSACIAGICVCNFGSFSGPDTDHCSSGVSLSVLPFLQNICLTMLLYIYFLW